MRAKPLFFCLLVCLVAGCRKEVSDTIPRFTEPARTDDSGSMGNAFTEYQSIGLSAAKLDQSMLFRGNYTPQMKKTIVAALSKDIAELKLSQRRPCKFRFEPIGPFGSRPEHAGWQILGKCLQWRIELAVKNDDPVSATSDLIVGTQFGWDLTGGGASDAAVGIAIINQCRIAFAPSMNKLSAVALLNLARNIERILTNAPSIDECLANERQNMLVAVDSVVNMRKEALLNEKLWDDFGVKLGPLGNDIAKALKLIKPVGASQWFKDWAQEATTETELVTAAAKLPTQERQEWPKLTMANRPWGMLSRVFFRSGRAVLAMHDEALARTRLLAILAESLAAVKAKQAAPMGIQAIPQPIRTDPYTGKPFIYQAAGTDFKLYSVGANLRDDGGQTDESYTAPDLKVEFEN